MTIKNPEKDKDQDLASKTNGDKCKQSSDQMIQNQFQAQIQILKTDNGREYFHSALGTYLMNNGIVHQSSCVDTPQQNEVTKRKNRHLLKVSHSIMFTSNVPKHF